MEATDSDKSEEDHPSSSIVLEASHSADDTTDGDDNNSQDLGGGASSYFPGISRSASSDADESSDDQFSDSEASSDSHSTTTSGRPRSSHHHHRQSRESRLLPYEDLTEAQTLGLNFAMEHRIFLRALLGLLNEREKTATETGMNDPNIVKCGPLKKASHLLSGVWKVKYVEVRRGMFSYFEDVASSGGGGAGGGSGGGNTSSGNDAIESGSLLQKNIPLDSNECVCRPVKIHRNGLNMAPGGAIFELKVGHTGRLWLARSRAERAAWIQAINEAMVGGSATKGVVNAHGKSGTVNSRSPYRHDLRLYLKTKSELKNATTKHDYVTALSSLVGREPLSVPVRWFMLQVDSNSGNASGPRPMGGGNDELGAFMETSVSSGVEQLWRDLRRDSICINKELFLGDSGHGPEKIIGALTRDIVATSRSESNYRYGIPESKAVAYARDVLLSINRTRSGGDSYFCIDTLCSNPDLVILVPSSREAEPLSITVKLDDSADLTEQVANYKTGWIRTRNRIQMSWRKRFFILTEGTLSFYRHAMPRPHDMRGQTVVTDASISVDKAKDRPGYFVISIMPKDGIKERFLYFNTTDKLLVWAYALECAAKSYANKRRTHRQTTRTPTDNTVTSLAAAAANSSTRRVGVASHEKSDMIEQAMRNHAKRLGLEDEEVEDTMARLSARSLSRVMISVQASTEYNICTTDPQGDDGDTWATLTATFLQRFRITGGRIVRGEEMVQIGATTCTDNSTLEGDGKVEGNIMSSITPRRKLGGRRRSSA